MYIITTKNEKKNKELKSKNMSSTSTSLHLTNTQNRNISQEIITISQSVCTILNIFIGSDFGNTFFQTYKSALDDIDEINTKIAVINETENEISTLLTFKLFKFKLKTRMLWVLCKNFLELLSKQEYRRGLFDMYFSCLILDSYNADKKYVKNLKYLVREKINVSIIDNKWFSNHWKSCAEEFLELNVSEVTTNFQHSAFQDIISSSSKFFVKYSFYCEVMTISVSNFFFDDVRNVLKINRVLENKDVTLWPSKIDTSYNQNLVFSIHKFTFCLARMSCRKWKVKHVTNLLFSGVKMGRNFMAEFKMNWLALLKKSLQNKALYKENYHAVFEVTSLKEFGIDKHVLVLA